jgi:single-strand DNA-binding protein
MNQCNFTGRIGADIECRYTANSKAVTNFSIAVQERKNDPVTWVDLVAWDKTAELLQQYTGKGSKIRVTCRYQKREWTDKEGNKRYASEFVIYDLEFLDPPNTQNQQPGNPGEYDSRGVPQDPYGGEDNQVPF